MNFLFLFLRDITLDQYFDFEDLSLEERTKLLQERLENDRGQVILVRDGDKADEIIALRLPSLSLTVFKLFPVKEKQTTACAKRGCNKGLLRKLDEIAVNELKNQVSAIWN